jgi:hypothetical protein
MPYLGRMPSGLNLPPFAVEFAVVVIVLRRIVIRRGHVKISLSETIKTKIQVTSFQPVDNLPMAAE